MNRKNLTSAVLAGLAGVAGIAATAQAVNVNPDGLGQVLIYPYYTVNGDNQTLLSVVNTTEEAKAVKVRFMEGQNSQEVLDFNLYMSEFDVWTAAIFDDDGTPTLVTEDTSCTVPYIYLNEDEDGNRTGMQEFLNFAYAGEGGDGGIEDISRAREGHFEMLEMGQLTDEEQGSATAATHVNGTPKDCDKLVKAWSVIQGVNGYWLDDQEIDIDVPIGGMFGGASIINVQRGTMFSYDATAINGWNSSGFKDGFTLHTFPGNVEPSLNSGDNMQAIVFADDGTLLSSSLSRAVDAVSYVFMHDQIMNEYIVDSDLGAGTEWVMTFPTKQFYVYQPVSGSSEPVDPFTDIWGTSPATDPDDLPCEIVVLDTIWDREEATLGTVPPGDIPPIVSPPPPVIDPDGLPFFELCYETSVIQFVGEDPDDDVGIEPLPGDGDGHVESILGSTNVHQINTHVETEGGTVLFSAKHGWARLQLDDYPFDENENGIIDPEEGEFSRNPLGNLEGLPVTGFSVQRFQNGFLGDGADVLANYGGIFGHKGTRKMATESAAPQ